MSSLGCESKNPFVRAAFYYADVLRRAEERYSLGAEASRRAIQELDLDWSQIRSSQRFAAANAAFDRGAAEACSRFGAVGREALNLRLSSYERVAWMESALNAAQGVGDETAEARQLVELGNYYRNVGRFSEAIAAHRRALDQLAPHLEPPLIARAWIYLGFTYYRTNQDGAALDCYQRGLKIAKQVGNRQWECYAYDRLAKVYDRLGKREESARSLETARQIAIEIGDVRGIITSSINLAGNDRRAGRQEAAEAKYREAIRLAREIGDRWNEAAALAGLSKVAEEQGQREQALEIARGQLRAWLAAGNPLQEMRAHSRIGDLLRESSRSEEAIESYRQAVRIASEHNRLAQLGQNLTDVGDILFEQGRYEQAMEPYRASLAAEERLGELWRIAIGLADLAECMTKIGDVSGAENYLRRAVKAAETAGHDSTLRRCAQLLDQIRGDATGADPAQVAP